MDSSTRTRSASLVRLRPDDLVRIVDEAKNLLAAKAADYVEERLTPQRTYRKYLEGIPDEESIAQDLPEWDAFEAEVRASTQPTWWISMHKRDGLDTVTGEAADVVPRLGIPRPNDYFSVRIQAGTSSIDIRLGGAGASFSVRSDDEAWLLIADLWAERQLRAISPRYHWLGKPSAMYAAMYGGALLAILTGFALRIAGVPDLTVLAVGASVALLGVAAGVAIWAIPGTVLSPTLGARARNVSREALWVIVGALAGQALSIAWTAITAAPLR